MSNRVEVIGNATLYLGDCMDIMPTIESVDHVFCDPPYESHMHDAKKGKRGIRIDGQQSPAALDFSSIEGFREPVTNEIVRISNGWGLVFCTPEGVAPWRDAIEAAGAKYKRACVWVKPDSAPQFNGQCPAMGAEMFVTAWCGSGHSRWNGGGRRNVFTHQCQPRDRTGEHPTEKPIALMSEIVSLFSEYGQTILDPFMGSGTTGISCLRAGRKFVGVERDQKYFDLACSRIEADFSQLDFSTIAAKNNPSVFVQSEFGV